MDVVRMIEDYRAQHPKEAELADDACKNVEVSFDAEVVQVFSLKDMEVDGESKTVSVLWQDSED